MNKSLKSVLLWVFSFIFTIFVAYYQRVTGPTYPVTAKYEINGEVIKNKMIRTYGGNDNAEIKIHVPDTDWSGTMKYKRYKSYDAWKEVNMLREGEYLFAYIPHQPPAGKVDYQVFIKNQDQTISLTEYPVRMRFKGEVPMYILLIHILIIFLAMVFSNRTGVEVIFKGPRVYTYTIFTIILLFIGGFIMGPIMQKMAFGAYWTGWPVGNDLTDSKTLVALVFWLAAFFILFKNRKNTVWALIAAVVLLLVYLIPHSVLGSELDYTAQ